MKKFLSLLAFFPIHFIFTIPLVAQVPSRPMVLGGGTIVNPTTTLGNLANDYLSGDWTALQKKTRELLKDFKTDKHEVDATKAFYFIVFLSHEKGKEPRLIRFPWHDPEPDPYASRIPGKKEIYEIVLSDEAEWTLKTAYLSTEIENRLLSQIPKFVKMIEPIFMMAYKEAETTAAPPIKVEIRSIALPYDKAKIRISDTAVMSDASLAKAIKAAASKLADDLQYRDIYASEFGKILAIAINTKIQEVPVADNKKALLERMREAVDTAFRSHIDKSKPKPDELKLAMKIEEEFLSMIEESVAKNVEEEFEYENVPLQHFDFGLISTHMLADSYIGQRVKVTDAGNYAADPPKDPLTAAIINFHPLEYDPKSAKMKFAEIFRLFGGFVLTPDYGCCAGVGFSLLRGLTINAGFAMMRIHSKRDPISVQVDGKEFEKPGNSDKPFKLKWGQVFFVGFGYNFQ